MKKILSKLRKMFKPKKTDNTEVVETESLDTEKAQTLTHFRVIDMGAKRLVITHDDVEPDLLANEVVRNLSEGYGISVGPFINGVAEVSWKLKPYKYYEIDYGVPGWERDCIAYAIIDENGEFLEKFRYTDYYGLKKMREKAEKMVSERKPKIDFFKDCTVQLTPEERRARHIPGDPRDYDDAFIEALEENAKKFKGNHK